MKTTADLSLWLRRERKDKDLDCLHITTIWGARLTRFDKEDTGNIC